MDIRHEGSSLWVAIHSGASKYSRIEDLRGDKKIWDKTDQALLEIAQDRPDVQQELIEDPLSAFAVYMIVHFTERLVKKDRFRPTILREVLRKFIVEYKL